MAEKPYRCMLAEDMQIDKIKFPVWVMPKIDGVRLQNRNGLALGRSGKAHKNEYTTRLLSQGWMHGFDGECIVGHNPCVEDLCRSTQSALNTISGRPTLTWYLFDYVTQQTEELPYQQRREYLDRFLGAMGQFKPALRMAGVTLATVPYQEVGCAAELEHAYKYFLELGYEGIIIRDMKRPHKRGRSTLKEQGLLRGKPWADAELLVTGFEEAQENQNEATVDERGYTKRSSHQDNKVGKGMVGAITGTLLDDVISPVTGKLMFAKGLEVTIGPGCLSHAERADLFANPHKLVGHIVTFKHFVIGAKDKPRMATYKSHRSAEDMG